MWYKAELSSEVKYISVCNIVGVSYPIISSALLAVTGRAACIGRPVVRLWYPLCHWSLFMVGADCSAESWTSFSEEERERVLKELYKFFTVCAIVCCSMYVRKQRGRAVFLFFPSRKKQFLPHFFFNVTDSFEKFKRSCEKFSGWEKERWKEEETKEKEKEGRNFFLPSPRIQANDRYIYRKLGGS